MYLGKANAQLKFYMIKATYLFFLNLSYHFGIIYNIACKIARLATNWLRHRCLLHKQSGIGLWWELNANIWDGGKMKHKHCWNSNTDFMLLFEPGLVNKHLWAFTDNICEATGCFPGAQHSEITGYPSFPLSTEQGFHFLLDCTTLLLIPLSLCKFLLLNSLCGQHPMAFLWEQMVFVV